MAEKAVPPPPPPSTTPVLTKAGLPTSGTTPRTTTSTGMYNDPPPELFFRGASKDAASAGEAGTPSDDAAISQAEMRAVLEAYLTLCTGRELAGANAKMAEDTTKRMQALLGALASDSVSPRVASLLRPLVVAVREARYKAALDLHVPIMTMHYAESGTWIVGLKRLLGLSADLASKS